MGKRAPVVVAKYIDSLEQLITDAAGDAGVESIHKLRVAIRRTNEALRIFEPELPEDSARRIRRRIRPIRKAGGLIRDRDMTEKLLRKHGMSVADPVITYLRGERAMAATQFREELRKLGEKKKLAEWKAAIRED